LPEFVWWVLLIWNIICCLMMAVDKRAAIKKRRRTPEARLLACGALLGAGGITAGMLLFRHKTRHLRFAVLMPLALLMQAALVLYLFINI
jgi:uncharacterized membrane protein YsdA (DUF1294 family)